MSEIKYEYLYFLRPGKFRNVLINEMSPQKYKRKRPSFWKKSNSYLFSTHLNVANFKQNNSFLPHFVLVTSFMDDIQFKFLTVWQISIRLGFWSEELLRIRIWLWQLEGKSLLVCQSPQPIRILGPILDEKCLSPNLLCYAFRTVTSVWVIRDLPGLK